MDFTMDMLSKAVITEIVETITVPSPKGRFERIHNRAYYGLSFCKEGQITYSHNGRQYVSDSEHAVLLPQAQTYTLYGDKTGIFPVINFQCAKALCDTIVALPVRNADPYLKAFEQIKNLLLFENRRTKVMSIFYSILYGLSSEGNPQTDLLLPAITYLEHCYTSPDLTNQALAARCNISEVYFRRLFTKVYGKTPKQFILDTRIDRAKQLLTDGILKIHAVSEACGFTNPYHFCRVFKQKTGLTPTEYMKKNRFFKI